MSSASQSTLVRYRPAILAITAIAAGYTVYYLRSSLWSSPRPGASERLHRSNAISRRTRQRAVVQEPSQMQLDCRVDFDADELMVLWRSAPDAYEGQFDSQLPGIGIIGLSPQGLGMLPTAEAYAGRPQQQSPRLERALARFRADYECSLIRAFLCTMMPPYAFLIDPDGHDTFVEAFLAVGFRNEAVVSGVLCAWNLGRLDNCWERQRYYAEHGITTPLPPRYIPPEANDFTNTPDLPSAQFQRLRDDIERDALRTPHLRDYMRAAFPHEDTARAADAQEAVDLESEHSWRQEEENDENRKEGQSLLNMLYHIAEDQSRREGYVHRQVSCNSCNTLPIRGIRYRCSNCADYDLCEQCEALQIHPKTHLFYKIRVPAPFFDNTQRPQPVRYPGKLVGLPNHLPRHVTKRLSSSHALELSEIEALWDQFKCLATADFPGDPLGIGIAIDRNVFDKCFLPSTVSLRKPPNMPIHDQIFSFFDTDNNKLMGFREFVIGIATIRTKDKDKKLRRTFNFYDVDLDGFVCRKDFLHMFTAYYSLSKDFTQDMIQNMEEEVLEGTNLQDNLLGTQPISSAYTGSIPPNHPRGFAQGKWIDEDGDLDLWDGNEVVLENDAGLEGLHQIIGDMSEKEVFGDIFDPGWPDVVKVGAEETHHLAQDPWPPGYVSNSDVDEALGKHVPIMEVTDVLDRLKVVRYVVERRQIARKEGIRRHEERRRFYEDERTKDESVRSSEKKTRGAAARARTDSQYRVPPPLEDDPGQEYLFQILQMSLNELLDPLFKLREDLALEAEKSYNERQIIKSQLLEFGGPSFRRLCHFQLNNLPLLLSQASEDKDQNYTNVAEEISKLLEAQEDKNSDHYLSNLKDMVMFRVIDATEYDIRVDEMKKTAGKPQREISEPSELKEFLAQKEKELGEGAFTWSDRDTNLPSNEAALSNVTQSEQANGLITSAVGNIRQAEADSTNDEDGPALEDFMSSFSGSGLPRQAVEEFSPEAVSRQSDAIAEAQSTPTEVAEADAVPKTNDLYVDRTMPQNMPNSLDESSMPTTPTDSTNNKTLEKAEKKSEKQKKKKEEGRTESDLTVPSAVPPRDLENEDEESRAQRQKLKYLLMMDILEAEDAESRGGAGRLNFEEFEAVMKSPAGQRLDFLGMFYEMVNY